MSSGAEKLPPEAKASDHETRLQADDKLELRTWLRLLTCSNMVERQVRGGLRRQFETTLPRFDVLAQLERIAPDAGLTMGELSERLMVSPGNLTGLVNRLAQEGLVARSPQPDDRRSFQVKLTDDGRRQFLAMTPANETWVDHLFRDLSREDLQQVYNLLGKMKHSITSAGDITGAKG
jgi:DNA-binding MarR family transcriptional regulator